MNAPCRVARSTIDNPFSFDYSVERNTPAAAPVPGTKRPGISFQKISSSHTSNRNNRLQKSHNDILNSFRCFIQVADARYEVSTMRKDSSTARLEEIAELQYDWNGYGAKEFSKTLIEKCKCIVRSLPVCPEIYPTGRQSVQFQYELKDKSYLEFEIFEAKTVCLQVPQRKYSDAITEEFSEFEIEKIKEIVSNFYGQGSNAK